MPLRARAAHPQPGEARGLGQALGAEHDQRHDRNDDQFGKTEIEHGAAAAAAASAPRVFVLLRVPLAVGFALLVLEAAGGRVLVGVAHALLEALDGLAQVTPGATQALVPKTRSTTTSTMIQCQMLKVPIAWLKIPEWSGRSGYRSRGGRGSSAAVARVQIPSSSGS